MKYKDIYEFVKEDARADGHTNPDTDVMLEYALKFILRLYTN